MVVLTTLAAEGTPVMTLDLFREWRLAGVEGCVLALHDERDELGGEFEGLGASVDRARIPPSGARRYPAIVRAVASACRARRPSAVLSMPFGWHAFVSWGARLGGVSTTAAHVGSYPPYWQGRAFWKFRAEVLVGRPVTTRLVCCSRYVEEGVRRHFAPFAGNTVVAYNGCDTYGIERRSELARAARPRERLRVGMVARVDSSKDHETLIRAVAVSPRRSDLELWIIGDGAGRPGLEKLVAELAIAGQVRFLGMRRDVPELLAQLDVFAFSVKEDEGLGIALIEAMAAGVPIVATDVGACREVLDDGALGTLVPPRDAPALAAALAEVGAGGHEIEQRTERARAKAHGTFSRQAMAAAYLEALDLDA